MRSQGIETRRRLCAFIARQPGITKTELCATSGLSWGTITHHLRILLLTKQVQVETSLRKVFLYPPSVRSDRLAHARLLRGDVPRRILRHLNDRPQSGIQDLSRALALPRKVVRRHVGDLVGVGLLTRSPDYRPKFKVAAPAVVAQAEPGCAGSERPAAAPAILLQEKPDRYPAVAAAREPFRLETDP